MGIISGLGSFRGQFGDHFRVGDHFGVGIISGAVQFSSLHREVFSGFPSPLKPKSDLIVLIVNFSCSVPN